MQCYHPSEFPRNSLAVECGCYSQLIVPVDAKPQSSTPFALLEITFLHVLDNMGSVYANVVRERDQRGITHASIRNVSAAAGARWIKFPEKLHG